MSIGSTRNLSWAVVCVIGALLAGIGLFLDSQFNTAIDTATRIARPHEVQTALEHTKATLDALQDSVQDFVIDGADGMLYQYEDAVRALGEQTAELSALGSSGLSPADLTEIDERIAEVRNKSRDVIEARNVSSPETVRHLADAGLAAVNAAQRKLDTVIAAQRELLQSHEGKLRRSVARMYSGLVATAGVVLCLLIGGVMLVEHDRRRSVAMQEVLQSENERLERAVQERSETLARTNRELSWFSKRALQIQEHERRNLALELHDQIGQELAALVVTLTRCERELALQEAPDAQEAVQEGIEIARAAYGDVHNLALELRPAMLDRLGLVPTLQWYARQQAKLGRCEISVEADTFPADLPADTLTAAFRIVQEAVSNAVRHGRPQRVWITARYVPEGIELRIRDDGAGFDLAAAVVKDESHVGLGLMSIRQRAEDAGGQVMIRSEPGAGTEVVALLAAPGFT